MEFAHINFSEEESFLQNYPMSDECKERYLGLVESHKQFLVDYGKEVDRDPVLHHLIFCLENVKIIGYRYFYFSPNKSHAELFALHVDAQFRRQGIASEMIRESIRLSNESGVNRFTIRMVADQSEERDGLLGLYEKIAEEQSDNQFEILYGERHIKLNLD
jgi:ribosomal protein S18 acetylase RimI-like enzyme